MTDSDPLGRYAPAYEVYGLSSVCQVITVL
jgi:hypothetical protein